MKTITENGIEMFWSEALKRYVAIPDGLVAERDACPCCHERDEDYLLWGEDESVQCENCGNVYNLQSS